MNRRQLAAIALLVVGAALFAIGTSVEKNRHHDEPAAAAEANESHSEAGESAEQREAEEVEGHSEATESGEGEILGIDRESTGLVVVAVLASLALAAALWRRPSTPVWIIAAVVAIAFAFFDVAEIIHQLDESDAALATLAAIVATAHVGTAVIAAAARRSQPAR